MDGDRLRLGVNIDHVATLRQVRGTSYPDLVRAAQVCLSAGADGITVHLREDRRHVQDRDVFGLRERLRGNLNLEMANAAEIIDIALHVLPDEVCLVPERREELTTEGGLDVAGQAVSLRDTVSRLRDGGIVVSLFIEPDVRQVSASAGVGANCVELHTGTYCEGAGNRRATELKRLIEAARVASSAGLTVNAGHGLNLDNIAGIMAVPHLNTLNIGHSIVAHAVFAGLDGAVRAMLDRMAAYRGGRI